MPDPKSSLDLTSLNQLSDDHRLVVQNALKSTLERELASITTNAGAKAAGAEHTRESGPLHGSQHGKGSATLRDHDLISRVSQMDENQFTEFSKRLSSIKQGINK